MPAIFGYVNNLFVVLQNHIPKSNWFSHLRSSLPCSIYANLCKLANSIIPYNESTSTVNSVMTQTKTRVTLIMEIKSKRIAAICAILFSKYRVRQGFRVCTYTSTTNSYFRNLHTSQKRGTGISSGIRRQILFDLHGVVS